MRGTISRGLLTWKLEMHMTFENRLYIPHMLLTVYHEESVSKKSRDLVVELFKINHATIIRLQLLETKTGIFIRTFPK